jgi:hypothetical protein
MSATARKLVIGAEDLLGLIALGMAIVGLVTTWSPPPEAIGGPPPAFGYIASATFLLASLLFFLAAHHLHKTASISPVRHVLPIACAILAPLLGLVSEHL